MLAPVIEKDKAFRKSSSSKENDLERNDLQSFAELDSDEEASEYHVELPKSTSLADETSDDASASEYEL